MCRIGLTYVIYRDISSFSALANVLAKSFSCRHDSRPLISVTYKFGPISHVRRSRILCNYIRFLLGRPAVCLEVSIPLPGGP